MNKGKEICKVLTEVRQQIADNNDIEYITSECHFQGECKGTCLKCESEVRYLENELNKRRHLGKVVAIAGISLGIAMTFAACEKEEEEDDPNILGMIALLEDRDFSQNTLFLKNIANENDNL